MTNPTPDATLLPCPFCGGGNIAYVTNGDREWTTCDDCLSEGPDAATQDEAIAAWNRRAGQSHAAGLLAALEELVAHCHEQERLLTEELHHTAYSGESLPLCNARAAIAAAKGAASTHSTCTHPA